MKQLTEAQISNMSANVNLMVMAFDHDIKVHYNNGELWWLLGTDPHEGTVELMNVDNDTREVTLWIGQDITHEEFAWMVAEVFGQIEIFGHVDSIVQEVK